MNLDSFRQRLSHFVNLAKPPAVSRIEQAAKLIQHLGHTRRRAFAKEYRQAVEILQLKHVPPLVLRDVTSIVDIGANVGDWTVAAAQLFPKATVRAYEPNPNVFATLAERIRTMPNAEAHQVAISSCADTLEFNAYEQSALGSLHRLSEHAAAVHGVSHAPTHRFTVPTMPLDKVLPEEPIDILKLDVQGHEGAVIAGGVETLQRTHVLLMEVLFTPYYQGDTDFWELHRLLTDRTPLKLWDLADVRRSPEGQAMWTDAVYVHEQHLSALGR